jgi:biopolymer transport protein ExbD
MQRPDLGAATRNEMLNHRNFGIMAAFIILTLVLAMGIILQKTHLAGPIAILPSLKNQFSTKLPRRRAIVITATLTSTLEDKVFLNDTPIGLEELPQKLNLMRKTNADIPVHFKIDHRVPWGRAMRIW